MGKILAKFRKEKSTQEVLETLQEKIDTLENFTLDTQEQKKRVVGNFLASSIGLYIIAFFVFYFVYFPPTWQQRIIYFIPLILFPFVIMLLRFLFSWYYQRKLNKSSKKLTALRAEKKKILEQVMDKETYKVAVNLLSRFAEKSGATSRTTYGATSSNLRTPSSKYNHPILNRSLPSSSTQVKQSMALTPSVPSVRVNNLSANLSPQISTPRAGMSSAVTPSSSSSQLLRRRTPFPVIDQKAKGVFEKIVDVLIGDGPGDRFAMICKECYGHNGMALKEDFEYTTFRCAFCNALNPARKARPAAPRLSTLPLQKPDDSSSDDKEDTDEELSGQEFPTAREARVAAMAAMAARFRDTDTTGTTSDDEQLQQRSEPLEPVTTSLSENRSKEELKNKSSEILEKSDSAIDDVTMSLDGKSNT